MTTKRVLFPLFFCFLYSSLANASEVMGNPGPEITKKTLELPAFSSIFLNSNYTVYLKQSNKQEVTVEALSEIYNISEFKVEDGTLHINTHKKKNTSDKSLWSKIDNIKIRPLMKVTISMKDVRRLYVNSGGKIIGENSLATASIDLALNGQGSMEVDLKGNRVKAAVSGSGNMTLKGYASHIEASMSGNGTLHAFKLDLPKGNVKMMGSGLCEVNVSQDLEVTIYGSGTVKYKGDTKNTIKKIYGSGSIGRSH